jgi:prevent-host-death family protein
MPNIGVRELKSHVTDVLRNVRETRARYVVTHRGEPVAVIVPYTPKEAGEVHSREEAWAWLFAAGEQLGRNWTSPLTSAEILDEMRR